MDSEIEAMGVIATALEPLDAETRRRVLKWAAERYQPPVRTAISSSLFDGMGGFATSVKPNAIENPPPQATGRFLSVHQLFDAAAPETGVKKVLVVAYWFQVVQGNADWDSQTVNTELKQMGHPSTNITRDLDTLQSRTPRMVMQTRKQGTSRQARKLYTLTREGIRAVETMLVQGDPLLR
jgi:hypothetical protein